MHTFSVGPWFKNVACLTSLLFFMETWSKAVRDPYTYCLEQPPPLFRPLLQYQVCFT